MIFENHQFYMDNQKLFEKKLANGKYQVDIEFDVA
jgi:hypothetical protein